MNNIPINTNNDNKENDVKKPSKKKKVLTVILIIMIVLFISNVLTKITVRADDSYVNIVANAAVELEWTPTDDVVTGNGNNVGQIINNDCIWLPFTEITDSNLENPVLALNNIYNLNTNCLYITMVYRCVNPAIKSERFDFWYNHDSDGDVYYYASYNSYFISTDYTITTFVLNQITGYTDGLNIYVGTVINSPENYEVVGCFIGKDNLKIAQQAVSICDYYNTALYPPTNVVYGTEDLLLTSYSTDIVYEAQGIVVPWDVYNLGIICSAVIDGTSVNMIVDVLINKDSSRVGNIVILDEAYHEYIFEVDLQGSAEYGKLKFSILKTTEFDVKYVAISDNYTMLSEHLVAKVNEYNDVGDSESYQAGYADGFKVGQQAASIGAFANTQLDVQWSIREVATGLVYEFYQQYPIAVNAGGISFEEVWYWYMNSSYNDRAYEVQEINFYISFTNENTLFKNSSFWWGNQSKSDVFLPYATYLVPTNISITNKLAVIEKYGDYFYITCDELVDQPIEQIQFTITNDNTSYYDIFITNKLTLFTDINQTIIDNQSFYLGEVKGIEYGEKVGYEKGEKDGYDKGYDKAYEDAKRDFYEKGFDAGKEEGYDVGFLKGREQGMNEEFSFYMIPTSIMDAISSTFFGWLDFDFFGVNMASFVLQLMTIAVFAWIWKKVA